MSTVLSTITAIGIIQCIIFITLNIQKNNKQRADYILIVWLMVFALHLVFLLLLGAAFQNKTILVIAKATVLLHGPFLYTYALSLMKEKISGKLGYHFLPFMLLSITGLMLTKNTVQIWEGFLLASKFVSIFIYPLYTLFWFKRKSHHFKVEHSNNLILEIRWIKTLAYLLLCSFTISVAFLLLNQVLQLNLNNHIDIVLYVLMITIMGYYGLKLGIVFKPNEFGTAEANRAKKPYQHSPLNDDRQIAIGRLIETFFDQSDAYLNTNFSLSQLSEELNIPKHHLSQVINTVMKITFYDLVNGKRIQHIIDRMRTNDLENITFEAMGYDAGFNTKAAFYFHFKKITGKTPGQYQKQNGID